MTFRDGGTLVDVVRDWAKTQPDAPALVAEGKQPLSYAALVGMSDSFRAALNASGFGRGDRIAIVHSGGADMGAAIVCVWGCATAVPFNPELTIEEFSTGFRQLRVDALLTDQARDSAAALAAERGGIPVVALRSRQDGHAGSIEAYSETQKPVAIPGPSEAGDIATIHTTSGTTSQSKVVPRHHRTILRNYVRYARGLELSPRDRCLNLMPLFHGHGINSGLGLCLFSGGSTAFLRPFDIETFERYILTLDPTWYTGAYTFQHQIHAHAERLKSAVASSRLRFGRSGSGPLFERIADDLERILGLPIIQSYGSSETGVIAINPQPPRLRKLASVGLPVDATTCVVDENGAKVPAGVQGEVAVAPDCVFDGYEDDEAANAAAFRNGYYHTGDRGYVDDDGYLFLTGRIKELINRGGEKIAPFEVERALLDFPGVKAAVAFPLPHPTLGEEVGAVIETENGVGLSVAEIVRKLREQLADFKIPRRFAFVDAVPKGPTGRVVRRELAGVLGLDKPVVRRSDTKGGGKRFPTALEAQLQELWAEALRLETVGLDEEFFALGGDSLQAIELFLRIEEELGCRLPRAILFESDTVAKMARRIARYNGSPCLVRVAPDGDLPPLFCIHGGDGNAVYFRHLGRHIGPSQPFYALQCVGLDGLEEPLTRVEDIALRYLSEIRAVQPHGPYYLAGFSFGGRVAYAMAQRLRAEGESVGLLAMFDTYSESEGSAGSVLPGTGAHLRNLAQLPWKEIPGYAATRLRNLARVMAVRLPEPVFAKLRALFSKDANSIPRSFRLMPREAHAMANRAFRPKPYDGDIVLFRAAENRGDRHGGWAALVNGRIQVREVPGGHDNILGEPQVQVLARQLRHVLAEKRALHECTVVANVDHVTAVGPAG